MAIKPRNEEQGTVFERILGLDKVSFEVTSAHPAILHQDLLSQPPVISSTSDRLVTTHKLL
jgi:hypothetical protein